LKLLAPRCGVFQKSIESAANARPGQGEGDKQHGDDAAHGREV
jgi:hypothetical protein